MHPSAKGTDQTTAPNRNSPLIRNKPKRSAVGTCTKYTLFCENCIILLLGLAFTSLSAYILVVKEKQVREYHDFLLDPACLMCTVGSVVTVMGFLGCVGALRENVCCLKMYYYLLCFFLLVEVVVAILAFVAYYDTNFQEQLFPRALFEKAIVNYRDDLDMKNIIDDLQKEFQCCGLSNDDKGYKDWNGNTYFNCSIENKSPDSCSVPQSCCMIIDGEPVNYMCGANIYKIVNDKIVDNDLAKIYTQGCFKSITTWIDEHSLVVGGVLLGILLPQIFIVILTRNLIDQIYIQKSKW